MTGDSANFWDKQAAEPTHNSWMAPLQARLYINEMVSGRPGGWPLDWFEGWLRGRRFRRALSVGCGTGPMERDLVLRNLCETIDAFDGSRVSIEIARREAENSGAGQRVHYYVADFNAPSLPRRAYDAVFFHQSAHHVGKLEKLFSALLTATTPDAVIYLDEYVGPSRNDWTEARLERLNIVYQSFPRDVRLYERLTLPVEYEDLSEAVRSAEIVDQLRVGFEVLDVRGYGGNVLSVLFPQFVPGAISDSMIATMIETEKEWLRRGEPPFHAIIVARPRRGLPRALARGRYLIAPKVKRLVREAAHLAGR